PRGPLRPGVCLRLDPVGFLYAFPPNALVGRDALLLLRLGGQSRPVDVVARYGQYFRSVEPADTIAIRRAGRVEVLIAAFRAQAFRGGVIADARARRTF